MNFCADDSRGSKDFLNVQECQRFSTSPSWTGSLGMVFETSVSQCFCEFEQRLGLLESAFRQGCKDGMEAG